MLKTLSLAVLLLAAAMPVGVSVVSGQNYPARPISIVAAEPGGGIDLVSRLIAPGLTEYLGQPVIVNNRPGLIAIETVAKAAPDGHTLLLSGPVVWLTQFMRDNVPWDTARDFLPVSSVSNGPNVLVVHPSLPVKSVQELIALAKARPGDLNYASGGIGAPPHLAGELFKAMTGVNIVLIPYKGAGLAMNALIGGQVQVMFAQASSVVEHVKSDRLRALAVTSAQPSALAPGLPTVAAAGLPGFEATSFFGMFAPARTPQAIVDRLNQDVVRVLNRVDVKAKFFNSGVEAVGSSPEQFSAAIKADVARMGKVIKDNRIRAE